MKHTKTTVSITKKLLSDLMDQAIFRSRQLEDDARHVYLDDERASLFAQKRNTDMVIARAQKAYLRCGGL